MKIQVLGSGCPTCEKLHQLVLEVARELDLEKNVEYFSGAEGVTKIVSLGAMTSPALAIDDQLVLVGSSNDKEKIKQLILEKQNL